MDEQLQKILNNVNFNVNAKKQTMDLTVLPHGESSPISFHANYRLVERGDDTEIVILNVASDRLWVDELVKMWLEKSNFQYMIFTKARIFKSDRDQHYKDKKDDSIQEMVYSIIFNLITDIPDSLLCPNGNPDKRAETLIKQAALKAATVSTSLSIPAGFTGVLTSIPDIAAVWRIQAQLVSDVACSSFAMSQSARVAALSCRSFRFRHSRNCSRK